MRYCVCAEREKRLMFHFLASSTEINRISTPWVISAMQCASHWRRAGCIYTLCLLLLGPLVCSLSRNRSGTNWKVQFGRKRILRFAGSQSHPEPLQPIIMEIPALIESGSERPPHQENTLSEQTDSHHTHRERPFEYVRRDGGCEQQWGGTKLKTTANYKQRDEPAGFVS